MLIKTKKAIRIGQPMNEPPYPYHNAPGQGMGPTVACQPPAFANSKKSKSATKKTNR